MNTIAQPDAQKRTFSCARIRTQIQQVRCWQFGIVIV
jgi:hypothetical protein